ncbi:MAG: chemotaxis protein CheX [Magnetococcales bacterium]|nr:chemotaxis protein CheX [Magnetococcales bacterium]
MSERVILNEIQEKLLAGLHATLDQMMATETMEAISLQGMEQRSEFILDDEVGGLVRFYGAVHEGMVGVSTSRPVAVAIVSQLLGLPSANLEKEDILDGVAELVNILCGGMKARAGLGPVTLSSPVAIIGREVTAVWKTSKPTLVLTFQTGHGPLRLLASV